MSHLCVMAGVSLTTAWPLCVLAAVSLTTAWPLRLRTAVSPTTAVGLCVLAAVSLNTVWPLRLLAAVSSTTAWPLSAFGWSYSASRIQTFVWYWTRKLSSFSPCSKQFTPRINLCCHFNGRLIVSLHHCLSRWYLLFTFTIWGSDCVQMRDSKTYFLLHGWYWYYNWVPNPRFRNKMVKKGKQCDLYF